MTASASADDRFTLSGSVQSRIYGAQNLSGTDSNFTNLQLGSALKPGDQDDAFVAITRLVLTFEVEAFENTKMGYTMIFDEQWGRPGGLHLGNYLTAYHSDAVYFEGLIPNTAATWKLGGIGFGATRLKSHLVFNGVAAGTSVATPINDTTGAYTWFAWLGEGLDGVGEVVDGVVVEAGNDWAAGGRIELAPADGLNVDLIYAYHRLECLAGTGSIDGDCNIQTMRVRNPVTDTGLLNGSTVREEDRHWVGVDVQYQYGDFTLSPTFIYHFGSSDLADGGSGDIASFLLDIHASYQAGPLQLRGKIVYTPGDPADEALGDGDTLNSWQLINVYNGHRSVRWFNLFGAAGFTDLGPLMMFGYSASRAISTNLSFDQFGLMHVAARADYTVDPKLTLTGTLGIFNAAEEVGRPMRLGSDMTVNPTFNYTGQDTHLATEVDVMLAYQLYPAATLDLWFAYALVGDALNLHVIDDATGQPTGAVAEAQDVLGGGVRLDLLVLVLIRSPVVSMADGFPSRRPLLFQLPGNPALMTVLDPRGGVNPRERESQHENALGR